MLPFNYLNNSNVRIEIQQLRYHLWRQNKIMKQVVTYPDTKKEIGQQTKQQSAIVIVVPETQDSVQNNLSINRKKTLSIEPQFGKLKSIRQQSVKLLSKTDLIRHKKVLVLYASGSSGANQNLVIQRGYLQSKIRENQYLCDYKIMQTIQDNDQFLITPQQENGVRIFYQIQEFNKINSSINMTISDIKLIAQKIYENYSKYDAFIVLCGFDVICSVATMISFMFQNLSKLVILTGGYFPLSYMRNDTVNNINQSFSIISFADRFNDVIVVCKNKGYRGNRSIKMAEGGFASVSSPNLEALVSVNIKIKFREYLYLPVPTEQFKIWTNVSCRVGIIKFHILINIEALQHQLNNPAYDGFVIESYGASNIPQKQDIWDLFKRVAEEKDKIFVNIGQSVKKQNSSMMKQNLQKYHIYYGGDMTTQAALSKLSYLLSKKYNRNDIKKLLYTNMRGELTEMQTQDQFEIQDPSFMELVQQSLNHYYPSNLHKEFMMKVENELALSTQTAKQFEKIFKRVKSKDYNQQMFKETMARLINENNLLHRAVQASNEDLYNYFLLFPIAYNKQDENQCSPLCYAILQKDKKAIQSLLRKGCKIICNQDDLFSSFISQLKQDNVSYFEMLYHVEFKETLRDVANYEGRTALHLAAILKANKSLKFLHQKFKFNIKQKDNYGKAYSDYLTK